MLEEWDKGELDFDPVSPRSIYDKQAKAMAECIAALKTRAVVEGIDL